MPPTLKSESTPSGRDLDVAPYTEDERRVVAYLKECMPDIGAGDDPIGFLLASHAALIAISMGAKGWTPSAYRALEDSNTGVRVEWRGAGTWAVVDAGHCLNKDGLWEYEPLHSARTNEFIQRCRFSLSVALQLADQAVARGD
jgi:hypothetical protein